MEAVDVLVHETIIEQMPLAAEVLAQTAARKLRQPVTPDGSRQKQAAVFSPGELMFSFLAVYPPHCPAILP